MNEESLLEKQKYLSAEILEANFDPEQFQDFMMNNSNKQLDLNDWTLSELKKIVAKYKKLKNKEDSQILQEKQQINLEKYHQKSIEEEREGNKMADTYRNKKQSDSMSVVPSSNKSLYQHFAFRKKKNLPQLYVLIYMEKKPFRIHLKNYSKTVPNNIFSSSYILYQIQTSEKWNVKRRFTDFQWLHKNLKKAYPGLPIPPIPCKTTIRSFDDKHLEQRMKVFEKFLSTLTYMPEICSDPILEIFLRGDNQYFSQARKKFQATSVDNYETCTIHSIWGEDLIIDEPANLSNHKVNQYNQVKTTYQNINLHLLNLEQSLKKAASDSFLLAANFQQAESVCKGFKNNGILGVLQQFVIQIGQHLSKTVAFFQESFYHTWNYENLYTSNLSDYIMKIKREQVAIAQKHKSMMTKASQSGSNNTTQPKMLKQFQIAKQQYKIKYSYTIREMERFEEQNLGRITKKWANDIKIYITQVNQLAINSVDQLTRTLSIGEGKDLMKVEYIKT